MSDIDLVPPVSNNPPVKHSDYDERDKQQDMPANAHQNNHFDFDD